MPGLLARLVVLLLTGVARSEAPPRDHEITVDDYFTLDIIEDPVVSPDGRHVAWVQRRWDREADGRDADIWVADLESRRTWRLTFEKANDTSPQWSPDGQRLYFASARKRGDEKDPPYNGRTQVWVMPLQGGEALPVTRLADGIDAFRLSKDGRALFYTQSREEIDGEWKTLREAHKEIEYGHGKRRVSTLWRLDLSDWRAEKLVDEKRYIRYFALSPGARRVAMITAPDDTLITHEGRSRVDVFDLDTRSVTVLPDSLWREQAPSPYGWLENPCWSSDGRSLAFTVSFDGYPTEILVAEWPASEAEAGGAGQPAVLRLARPAGVFVTGGLRWHPGRPHLYFVGDERARARIFCLPQVVGGGQGEPLTITGGDVVVFAYDFRGEKELVLILGTTLVPQDIYLASADPARPPAGESGGSAAEIEQHGYRRITDINPQVARWKLPRISIVSWKGAGGEQVEGILELPPDYQPGTALPTVVELHGGPTDAARLYLQFWIYGRTLLPARGYALFSPNYRGSTGYGDRFLIDLIGRENDIEVEDILTGVDALIERGIADPDRLGVIGWSNGGFLTNCLITRTDRFKAASSGAGVVDQFMQWALEDTPGHVINYMRGLPWDQPEAYRRGSPSFLLGRVKTPTLIHVGADDARVPAAHSRTLFRALHEYVGVPTQLLVYPGQGHGLTTYRFRKAKMEWDLAWFDRYLLGRTDPAGR
jgi:dipeptidyl aminopeptidase/acylaminoacyl peptidase